MICRTTITVKSREKKLLRVVWKKEKYARKALQNLRRLFQRLKIQWFWKCLKVQS